LILSRAGTDGGLKGLISTLEPIEIGRKATIQVKLFDTKTGMPAGDTVKWLGAAGHMMIFHKDGQTVVHSHPAEDAENEALVKKGIVRFSGRFPKAGKYKVYAQFDWNGKVRTLPFTIEVKK
jgi:plastocyanin